MNFGLKLTEYDPRDYSHKKTFSGINDILPDNYLVGSTLVLNQYESIFCTAFASCIIAALEDNQIFSPEWYFAKEAELSGSISTQDLRTAAKTAIKYGFLLQNLAQNSLLTQTEQFLADSKNWPFSDDLAAANYKKKSYFRVDGNFQEIKQVLFQNKKSILTGVAWQQDWQTSVQGIIPETSSPVIGLHSIPIIGFKTMDGIEYIIIQNSYGTTVGDNGLFYFSEKVFNKNFNQPMYIFLEPGDNPQPIGNWFQILIHYLLTWLS